MMRFVRVLETALIAMLAAVVIVGISVWILELPWFTSAVVPRVTSPEATGLEPQVILDQAQAVREFVTSRAAEPLPATIGGRAAFDESAVAHLVDVRELMLDARQVTMLLAVLLIALIGQCLLTGWERVASSGLRAGGWVALAGVAFAAFFGTADFGAFFARFHDLFFEPGTWVFASNALLIQLFPETFWTIAGLILGLFVAIGALGIIVAGRLVDVFS
ncbi:MAG: DUF1461 domain-containing protein [Anaerosomatales bacterium]|nr:DUF1461 domain-containing protein [Anaerosomatales bacterium]